MRNFLVRAQFRNHGTSLKFELVRFRSEFGLFGLGSRLLTVAQLVVILFYHLIVDNFSVKLESINKNPFKIIASVAHSNDFIGFIL